MHPIYGCLSPWRTLGYIPGIVSIVGVTVTAVRGYVTVKRVVNPNLVCPDHGIAYPCPVSIRGHWLIEHGEEGWYVIRPWDCGRVGPFAEGEASNMLPLLRAQYGDSHFEGEAMTSTVKTFDAVTGAKLSEHVTVTLDTDAYQGRLRRISAQWNVGQSCVAPSDLALIPSQGEV